MRVQILLLSALVLAVYPANAQSKAEAEPVSETDQNLAKRKVDALADLPKGAAAHIVSPFVISSPNAATASAGAAFTQSLIKAYTNGRFNKMPAPVSVFIFPEAARFEEFCKKKTQAACISVFGFYLSDSRSIVMRGGADGTLSHELVHPFVEADFPGAPIWLNEGIASLFEGPVLPKPGEIHGNVNWRLPRLQNALNNKEEEGEVNVSTLFTTEDAAFRANKEDLHYSMARFFCQWLDTKGKLWDFYHAYRDNVGTDAKGTKALSDTLGMSPDEATKPWRAWVRSLRR
jgi:hypothetical protein